jgi:hypothetical protein
MVQCAPTLLIKFALVGLRCRIDVTGKETADKNGHELQTKRASEMSLRHSA